VKWGTPNKIENGIDPEHLLSSGAAGRIGGAVGLMCVAIWKLWRARHPTWMGMQVSFWDLTFWSSTMASAHGAGS
jgi:hypothetical protein